MTDRPNPDDPEYQTSIGGVKFFNDVLKWKIEEIDKRLDKIEEKLEEINRKF